MLLLFQGGSSPVTHATSGVLAGPGSVVVGSAARFRAHPTSGVLAGPGSVVAGSASSATARASSGALTGQASAIAGSAARTRVHATDGELAGPGSVVVGAASLPDSSVPATAGGYRFFGWTPDEKKKKPVVEIGVTTENKNVSVRYISAPAQPRFPIEVLQSVQEIISKNNYRRSELLRKIAEAEEEENILIILSELN